MAEARYNEKTDKIMEETKKKAERLLKDIFGYDSFRPLQLDIIQSVISGCDTLAIMPTGGGKSLCYQIPALIFNGITIVVSPLISLMQDQVSSLQENGVEAVFLNSSLTWEKYIAAVRQIKAGKIKLVYVSPEGLATERLQGILHDSSIPVSCITIDEAHCVSEWGHDFRPDYLEIAAIRRQFPEAVCLALTATATISVRQDIMQNLQMKNPKVFTASFNRANIFLEVKPKKNALQQVTDCIRRHRDESGIIYCFSRKHADELTASLDRMGFSVLNYHAGLSDKVRADHQDKFIKDKVRIMVATVAFGMGIDKPNVRYVIHYDMPKSLEEYYQEIGRAGRDGLPSHALLLYSAGDIHKIRFFFEDSADPEKAEMLLKGMTQYASTRKCRRQLLLGYFGEVLKENSCAPEECCDNCVCGPVPDLDVTIPAQKFMSCIIRTKQRFGASYIIDVLLGSKQKRILENRHETISTWGIGAGIEKDDWFALSEALVEAGYIQKYGEYNVLVLTKDGQDALVQRKTIKLPLLLHQSTVLNAPQQKKSSNPMFMLHKKGAFVKTLGENDLALYEEIKEWRKKNADEQNVPPYVIFGDKTLEELVEKKPQSEAELLSIFGIGTAKAEKIGSQLLRIISERLE